MREMGYMCGEPRHTATNPSKSSLNAEGHPNKVGLPEEREVMPRAQDEQTQNMAFSEAVGVTMPDGRSRRHRGGKWGWGSHGQ